MKYTQAQIQAGVKFLQNKNVSFDIESNEHTSEMVVNMNIAVNDKIWTDGTSIWNNNVVKGVKVDSINLVSTYYDDDEDAYWSGGLSGTIAYDGSGKDGTWYDGADDENNVLINKIKDEQDSDGMISDFLDFDYSEQGMQDDGAVNLDVDMDGHFWIKCNDELVKFVNTKVA